MLKYINASLWRGKIQSEHHKNIKSYEETIGGKITRIPVHKIILFWRQPDQFRSYPWKLLQSRIYKLEQKNLPRAANKYKQEITLLRR